MPTTLKDIALAAGVSLGTVNRALKHRDRINPQVAEKIRDLAKEMNYQPNRIASGLKKISTAHKIAVVLHIKGNEFFDEIIKGIRDAERHVRDYGISIQIYYCKDFDATSQLANIEKAINNGANALVVVPINSPIISQKLRLLKKQNFPVVFLNAYLNRVSCLSSIHCDYHRSGRIGGMLINRLSHSDGDVIAFFPSSAMLGSNLRREGFEHYLSTADNSLNIAKIVELTNNSDEDIRTMSRELKAHPQVTSILYCGDAKAALTALAKVERPITSVFYDLSPETLKALLDNKIDATITQSPKRQGYKAIDVLFDYFISNINPPTKILMDSQIIFKECID